MSDLVVIKQLPIIEERLHELKSSWEQKTADAEAMVCTEDTIKAIKAFRAEMRKEYQEVEDLRLQIKRAIMEPYEQFEKDVYRVCVYNAFADADGILKRKIDETEDAIKKECEDGLREYFAELCAVRHLDWLTYEHSGIKVDMASAKAKTPKKLREQLTAFVNKVGDDVAHIMAMDNADEIMVEYKRTLDAPGAFFAVKERHRRIEEERSAQEARKAEREREAEAVRKVESLAPPVQVKPNDKDPNEVIPRCTFTAIGATRAQLRRLKEFMEMEGIRYE